VERPHATQGRVGADAARLAAQQRAGHAAAVARRGAAARRRAVLTAALLFCSVVGWAVVGLTTVTFIAGVAPTFLLGSVLVMGRRAVLAGQSADADFERRRHELPPTVAAADARSQQRRTQPVVGRAVHPSDAHTDVFERITADLTAATVERISTALGTTDQSDAGIEDGSWEPVPVPRPTYTMKASAPHREPAPLTEEDFAPVVVEVDLATAEPATEGSRTATAEQDGSRTAVTKDGTRTAAAPQGIILAPASATATGGIDLDAVLARRRASGQ
jgi:hypothetical protein